jgi:hypothetical protein
MLSVEAPFKSTNHKLVRVFVLVRPFQDLQGLGVRPGAFPIGEKLKGAPLR